MGRVCLNASNRSQKNLTFIISFMQTKTYKFKYGDECGGVGVKRVVDSTAYSGLEPYITTKLNNRGYLTFFAHFQALHVHL